MSKNIYLSLVQTKIYLTKTINQSTFVHQTKDITNNGCVYSTKTFAFVKTCVYKIIF